MRKGAGEKRADTKKQALFSKQNAKEKNMTKKSEGKYKTEMGVKRMYIVILNQFLKDYDFLPIYLILFLR